MKMLLLAAFLMVAPSIYGENIFLDNLKPEEAQKYLSTHDLTLKYAPKIGESALPLTRSYDGDNVYRGRKISNPNDYLEDTFLANQFHGQDGLGRALFGYTDWNQGRVEAINGNGHVRGSYKYVDANGKDFVANYWSDGLGFHHEDNRPKVVLQPVTDTPAVQRARAEHFRKWNEAAAAAKASPDPDSDYYNRDANRYDEDQDKIDQALEIIGSSSNQNQALTRYPNLSNQRPVVPDRDYNPASSQDSITVDRLSGKYNRKYDAEPTGPPHGFYYNFDYPVHLLRKAHGKLGGDQYVYGSDYNTYDNSEKKNQYSAQQYSAGQQGQYGAGQQGQYSAGQQGQYGAGQQGQYGAGQQRQYNAGHQGQYNAGQEGQYRNQYENQGEEGQYNAGHEGQYKNQYENQGQQGQYNAGQEGQYRSQYETQGQQGQFNAGQQGQFNAGQQGQFRNQYESQGQYNNDGQYNNQGQYTGQGQSSKFASTQGLKKFDSFFNSPHKRTVEDQVANPGLKADLTEARVDAVHDVQVHPLQRAALDAEKAEGQ